MGRKEQEFRFLPRRADADDILEIFLVAAVASVLGIRFYLQFAGYPQLGAGTFHIAHVLWGGVFMMAALVVAFAFLGTASLKVAALLGGIGFGAFIDELGKFITSDNDYFFQPTIALIYVVFVVMYLVFRWLGRFRKLTKQESLVNALSLTQEAALHRMDKKERADLKKFLVASDQGNPIVQVLRPAVQEISVASSQNNLYERTKNLLKNVYARFVHFPWFYRAVITVFVANSLFAMAQAVGAIWRSRGFTLFNLQPIELTFIETGELLFSVISGILVAVGVAQMRISRLRAYYLFRYAILVSIFLTNFFLFFQEELGALTALFGNIILLGVVNYLISQEKEQL